MSPSRIAASLLWFSLAAGVANAQVTTIQSAISQVDANGIRQAEQSVSATNGFASSQAIWPAGTDIAQARTAARSRDVEIAANARVFSESFTNSRVFDLALSQATYTVEVDPLLVASTVGVEFFLPPAYVELVHNAEIPFLDLEASFLADLRVCTGAACGVSDQVFFLQVNASGSYRDNSHGIIASGDPALDLTPLENPTVTDSVGFIQTYLVEFPAFTGHVNAGLPANVPIRVEYTLQARASGDVSFNSAIAAVNDPFLVDTDPVMQGIPLQVTVTPVPEPASWLLSVLALVTAAFGSRRVAAILTCYADK